MRLKTLRAYSLCALLAFGLSGAAQAESWPDLGSTSSRPHLELADDFVVFAFPTSDPRFEDSDLMSGFQLDPEATSAQKIASLGKQSLPPPPRLVTVTRLGGALAGFWAAALAHEAGHAVAAWSVGAPFEWPRALIGGNLFLPAWTIEVDDDHGGQRERAFVAAAGLGSSMVISEALLLSHAFPKNDTFTTGFLIYDIANAVGYTVADVLSTGGFGDIRAMREGWGNDSRHIVYGVLLTKAAVNLVRLVQNKQLQKLRYWRSVDPPDSLSSPSR